jgi:outer membrane protein TolC
MNLLIFNIELLAVKKFGTILCGMFLVLATAHSQTYLSVNDALREALYKNYDIIISNNNEVIDKTNNTLGNSGFLPTITLNGANNYGVSNINQEISTTTGTKEIVKDGAINSSLTANFSLNWTLFDGGKMCVTKRKLNEIQAQGELEVKAQVQQTISNVIGAYYSVLKQKQQLLSIREAIKYNTERVKILEATNNNGLSPKNFLLQAKIDLNGYKQSAINQKNLLLEAKRSLNQLLARDSEVEFDVADSIPNNYQPNKDELTQKLFRNNLELLILEKAKDINKLTVSELNATRYPKVNFNSAYNYSRANNSAGNLLRNNSSGLVAGASVTMPVFQGGNINRQVKVAKLQYQSGIYTLDKAKLQLKKELQAALDDYQTQKELLEVEIENDALSKENLVIAIERLRLGQSTSLEARQAQESFVESETRRINFNYNLKLAETHIKHLVAEF